ncbi:MAG TPA: hypothetical protein VF432_29380 [Thermoanaerobaculia bacterium]
MRKAILIVSGLLFIAAVWAQEPKAFRGVPFGASEEEVASTLKLSAVSCLDMDGQRSCIHHTSLGEVKVMEVYQFDEDRLVQVFLSFKSPQYSLLREEFIKLYGKPTEIWTEPYETVGGKHRTEMLEWRGDKMIVRVEQFGPSLHEGIAVVATREWFEKSESE